VTPSLAKEYQEEYLLHLYDGEKKSGKDSKTFKLHLIERGDAFDIEFKIPKDTKFFSIEVISKRRPHYFLIQKTSVAKYFNKN